MHRSVRRMRLRYRITAGRYIHAQSPTNFANLYRLWWRLLINAIFSSGMLNNLQLNKLPTSISNDASTNIYYMNLCILHVNNVSVLEKWKLLSFNAAEKKTVMSIENDISELILSFVPDLFMLYQPCLCTKSYRTSFAI